jgi:NTP pyrophosphatase (non-canonical NTP hydrolase)
MYYLYHIPSKKIGVTRDLKSRVEEQQGYDSSEYDILMETEDIDLVSKWEITLQKAFGYRVDQIPYNKLNCNKQMKINVTEQTTTFPCPVNKLKGRLMDEIGMEWKTDHGIFRISQNSIKWIMKNVKTSMYNDDRCYVYNKAFSRYYSDLIASAQGADECCETDCCQDDTAFNRIRQWADERGLYEKGDAKTQYLKLMEEAGELGRALLKNDIEQQIDAIGDMVVVLTNLSELIDVPIEECIESAYKVISKRTGKMINGTFVKDN